MFSSRSPLRGVSVAAPASRGIFSADRLKKLVRYGVLRRARYSESPARYEYILTQRGLDLYPMVMAIVHWGDPTWWTSAAARCCTSTRIAESCSTR